MKVAVTGASGFIGSHIVRALVDAGHEVLAFSRRPAATGDGITWKHWDLTQGPLRAAPAVEAVLHAAAHVDDWDPWPVHERVTVDGTRAVLDTWPSAKVVLVSSCSVYPLTSESTTFAEDVPVTTRPLSNYVRAKIVQERLVMTRPDAVVLRPHAVYGTGDTTLLPRLARARRRGRIIAPGGRDTLVHLTSVELLAAVAARVIETRASGILNVADREPLPLAAVVDGLRAANGWPESPLFLGESLTWRVARVLEWVATARHSSTPPLLTKYAASHTAVSRVFDTSRLTKVTGLLPAHSDLSTWHT